MLQKAHCEKSHCDGLCEHDIVTETHTTPFVITLTPTTQIEKHPEDTPPPTTTLNTHTPHSLNSHTPHSLSSHTSHFLHTHHHHTFALSSAVGRSVLQRFFFDRSSIKLPSAVHTFFQTSKQATRSIVHGFTTVFRTKNDYQRLFWMIARAVVEVSRSYVAMNAFTQKHTRMHRHTTHIIHI